MNEKELDVFQQIMQKSEELNKLIDKIRTIGVMREVKPFNKSGHITLGKEDLGKDVLVIKLPKKE